MYVVPPLHSPCAPGAPFQPRSRSSSPIEVTGPLSPKVGQYLGSTYWKREWMLGRGMNCCGAPGASRNSQLFSAVSSKQCGCSSVLWQVLPLVVQQVSKPQEPTTQKAQSTHEMNGVDGTRVQKESSSC
eukprot:COSAG02_NODE_45_length_45811_cov_83.565891_26_plen_129_part_00